MSKKPTITTVAHRAGVAVSTVSRFLNGHSVSPAVRARLSEIIATLGYSRSWTARNLSLGRKGCIGVIVDSSEDPWFVQVLTGIEEELSTRDTSLMLSSLELRGAYDPSLVFEWIRDRRVDGLIIAKTQRRERALLHAAADANLPIVSIAPDEIAPHTQVLRVNNAAAGTAIALHLADLGHRHIAFAGGPEHSFDSKQRLRGLREGLALRGIKFDPKLEFSCNSWRVDAGSQFAETFFDKPPAVTAVVLANDALAFGFLRVAQQRGYRVPHDLSVAAFDGHAHGAFFWPALTTAAQPMREMGRVACRRLFEVIADPGRIETIEFSMELTVRESTGPAGKGERPLKARGRKSPDGPGKKDAEGPGTKNREGPGAKGT